MIMNQTKKKNPLKRLLSMRGMGQVVTVTIGLIVLLVAFALINPNFWSPTNRTNLLRQIAPIRLSVLHSPMSLLPAILTCPLALLLA